MLRTKAFLEPGNHRARIGAISSEILFIRGGAGRGRGRGRARVESWFGLAGNNSESQFVRRRINSNFAGRMNSPRNCVSPHRPIPLRANLNRAASTSSTPPANLERQRCIILPPPPPSFSISSLGEPVMVVGVSTRVEGGRRKRERASSTTLVRQALLSVEELNAWETRRRRQCRRSLFLARSRVWQ